MTIATWNSAVAMTVEKGQCREKAPLIVPMLVIFLVMMVLAIMSMLMLTLCHSDRVFLLVRCHLCASFAATRAGFFRSNAKLTFFPNGKGPVFSRENTS